MFYNEFNLGITPILYWNRHEQGENLPLSGHFYYSHIQNYGELLHETEIDCK